MGGWQGEDVYFSLQMLIEQAVELPEIFSETQYQHVSAMSQATRRLQRDVTIHNLLVKYNLSIYDFPNKDPYGPTTGRVSDSNDIPYNNVIIEAQGSVTKRAIYTGWLTRDSFEAVSLGIYGLALDDFEKWAAQLEAAEIDIQLTEQMNKLLNFYHRKLALV